MNNSTTTSKHNNFPDCLSFELSTKSKKEGMFSSKEIHEVILTINFGEEDISFQKFGIKGKGSFCLRGGKLRLQLTNATIPNNNINADILASLPLSLDREIDSDSVLEKESGLNIAKLLSFSLKGKEGTKTSTKLKDTFYTLNVGGTDENRTWNFETPSPPLRGRLSQLLLATLNIVRKPVTIIATFEINDEDIQLTSGRLFFTKNIAKNKRAWIEREIFFSYLKPKLQPYLSRVELTYE